MTLMMSENTEVSDQEEKARDMAKLILAGAVHLKTTDVLNITEAVLGNEQAMNTTNPDTGAMRGRTLTIGIRVRSSTANSISGGAFNNIQRWKGHDCDAMRL